MYTEGEEPCYTVSDAPVWPKEGLQEKYSMTENEVVESEEYTQKMVCFSPNENSFSSFCLRLLVFAVKDAP